MDDIFVEEEAADAIMKDYKFLWLCLVNKAAPERGYLYPPGKDFDPHEITLDLRDKAILENTEMITVMKEDSIATACNTNFEYMESSAETVWTERNISGLYDGSKKSWEFLLNDNPPGKTQKHWRKEHTKLLRSRVHLSQSYHL